MDDEVDLEIEGMKDQWMSVKLIEEEHPKSWLTIYQKKK